MSITCCDILQALTAPREFMALGQLAYAKLTDKRPKQLIDANPNKDEAFCYMILKEVSRSFYAVVMQLDGELRNAVCVFYLVLRALDTIEDDMSISIEDKTPELLAFHEKLDLDSWSYDGAGQGFEKMLLMEYPKMLRVYHALRPENQAVIKDITRRMGEGMVKYLTKTVETVEDYNEYCFFVAGLVGYGLTDLWDVINEGPGVSREIQNSMGLFLQKVNIIRDYHEDITDSPPRCYWPKEIWSHHADKLNEFLDPTKRTQAVDCLNELIEEALSHLPDCIQYLSRLRDPLIYNFSAIPQVMALATLVTLYDNPLVFEGKVKIRKGESARIFCCASNISATKAMLTELLRTLQAKTARAPSLKHTIDNLLVTLQ